MPCIGDGTGAPTDESKDNEIMVKWMPWGLRPTAGPETGPGPRRSTGETGWPFSGISQAQALSPAPIVSQSPATSPRTIRVERKSVTKKKPTKKPLPSHWP